MNSPGHRIFRTLRFFKLRDLACVSTLVLVGAGLQGCDKSSPVGPASAGAASSASPSSPSQKQSKFVSPSTTHADADPGVGAQGSEQPDTSVPASAEAPVRAKVSSDYENLAKLMQEGLHEPFTELSFTVWHDKPLTSEKFETISRASLEVQKIAAQIPAFTRSRWTGEEIAYFENTALRLADLAGFLSDAAKRQQQDHVVHYLMDLETTCQKCHAEFAPDLKF